MVRDLKLKSEAAVPSYREVFVMSRFDKFFQVVRESSRNIPQSENVRRAGELVCKAWNWILQHSFKGFVLAFHYGRATERKKKSKKLIQNFEK